MSSARHLQHQSHSIVHITSKTINISLAAVVVAVPHDNDNDTYTEQLYSNYLMFSDCVFIFCSASQRLFSRTRYCQSNFSPNTKETCSIGAYWWWWGTLKPCDPWDWEPENENLFQSPAQHWWWWLSTDARVTWLLQLFMSHAVYCGLLFSHSWAFLLWWF